jgi:hypothetical protein
MNCGYCGKFHGAKGLDGSDYLAGMDSERRIFNTSQLNYLALLELQRNRRGIEREVDGIDL